MESTRNFSLTIVFFLTFLVIASSLKSTGYLWQFLDIFLSLILFYHSILSYIANNIFSCVCVDLHMELQGRRMAREVGPLSCISDADCKNYKCPPSLSHSYCEVHKCTCGNWSKPASTNKTPSPDPSMDYWKGYQIIFCIKILQKWNKNIGFFQVWLEYYFVY